MESLLVIAIISVVGAVIWEAAERRGHRVPWLGPSAPAPAPVPVVVQAPRPDPRIAAAHRAMRQRRRGHR